MTEQEKNLGHRWFEEVWNQARRESIAELFAPDGVIHDGDTRSVGPEGFYPFFDRIHGMFSDLRLSVDDYICAGDRICVRWSSTGKHTGDSMGIAPSGVTIHITGISILRVKDGMLVEGWQNWDMLGMLRQVQAPQTAPTYIGELADGATGSR